MIETKFKWYIFLLPVLAIAFTLILFNVLFTEGAFSPNAPIYIIYFVIGLFIFLFVHILFGEIRTKAISLSIEKNLIIKKSWLGLGKGKVFKNNYFDGYNISILCSRGGCYEYLYLTKNGKKTIKISEFYHVNYSDVKNIIHKKFNFNGNVDFCIIDEITETFK